MADITCPFCGFNSDKEYAIQLHIEEHHTEGSPFIVQDEPGCMSEAKFADTEHGLPGDAWIKCTRAGCGEYVLLSDVDEHLVMHAAAAAMDDDDLDRNRRTAANGVSQLSQKGSTPGGGAKNARPGRGNISATANQSQQRGVSLINYFKGQSNHGKFKPKKLPEPRAPGRLGRRELGPHAFEERMPNDVRRRLIADAMPRHVNRIGRDGRLVKETIIENETSGLIPILADLCALDPTTEATYFCSPSVRHIHKLSCDGNFCGYWNIQMLLSDLSRYNAASNPTPTLPNVLEIQDAIEQAWDNRICHYGRTQTGGIKGTRKWIGTNEALAYFLQIGADVEALSFTEDDEAPVWQPAATLLLDHVEAYFMSGLESAKAHGSSHTTRLAPVYFQRFGHSMTIVGLERKQDGSRNLLVFDPSFATSEGVTRLIDGRPVRSAPEVLLKAYRRGGVSLARWDEFEILVVSGMDQ